MPTATCFDEPKLKDYLLGRLPDDESELIAAHVDACPNCEATISGLDGANDTLTSGLKRNAAAGAAPSAELSSSGLNERAGNSELSARRPPESFSSEVLRDYRLLEQLGAGGMGTVFKAVHTRLDRLVAVKLLPARRLGDPLAVARFQREMRVIGQLSHPAIVQATDAGEVDGTHFLVMEYVDGMDLNRMARWCGALSIADACEIARQAALGLEYAHQQGVVHRDVKPSNVMLSVLVNRSTGAERPDLVSVKLLDLGLALLSGVQAAVDELTTVGQLMGTLDYMAPEQFEDSHLVDARADVYSLAATLYRLLTGEPPYGTHQHKSPLQKLKILATAEPMPLCQRRSDVPAELGAAVDRALSRESADRFQSMREFAETLSRWVEGHDLVALWHRASQAEAAARAAIEALEHSSCAEPMREASRSVGVRAENATFSGTSSPSSPRVVPVSSVKQAGEIRNRRRNKTKTLWVVLALAFLGALGVVITIETNKGVLVVESVKDGLEVRLKKSGRVVDQFQITHGASKTRVTAGEYELELVGETDGFNVEGGTFTLIRGGTAVARIVERPLMPMLAETFPENVGDLSPLPGNAASLNAQSSRKPAQPKRPPELLDLNAKGMESFEATNPEVARERKVRDALAKLVDMNCFNETLKDVLAALSETSGVVCFADTVKLEEAGISLDAPITLNLKQVPLASVLHKMARQLEVAWSVDDQRIAITSAGGDLEQKLMTRFYPVGRILPGMRHTLELWEAEPQAAPQGVLGGGGGGFGGGGGGGGFYSVSERLGSRPSLPVPGVPQILNQFGGGMGVEQAAAAPLTLVQTFSTLFSCLNGTWEIDGGNGTLKLLNNVLVVRQTRQVHWQIESLIRQIEVAFAKPLPESIKISAGDLAESINRAIDERLQQRLDMDFFDIPLSDVVNYLAQTLKCNVQLDQGALEDAGVSNDTQVTLKLTDASGEVVLRTLLSNLQMGVIVEHGVLTLTTADEAQNQLTTKLYDIRDLTARGLGMNELSAAIQEETSGEWEVTGGAGNYSSLTSALMVVRQTREVHREIEQLFKTLDRVLEHGSGKQAPSRNAAVISPPMKVAPKTQPQPESVERPTPKTTHTAEFTYDGKTLNELIDAVKTERSPQRLAATVDALQSLCPKDRQQEVATLLLAALRGLVENHFETQQSQPFVDSVRVFVQQLPVEISIPSIVAELENGNSQSRRAILESQLLMRIPRDELAKRSLSNAFLACVQDPSATTRSLAVSLNSSLRQLSRVASFRSQLLSPLAIALNDKSLETRSNAAIACFDAESQRSRVIEVLREVMREQRDSAAVFTPFIAMGPLGAAAVPELAELARNTTGRLTQRPRPNPSRPIAGESLELSSPERAVVALASIGPAAKDALPQINEAIARCGGLGLGLNLQNGQPRVFENFVWNTLSFDLLIAARERITGIAETVYPVDNKLAPEISNRLLQHARASLALETYLAIRDNELVPLAERQAARERFDQLAAMAK